MSAIEIAAASLRHALVDWSNEVARRVDPRDILNLVHVDCPSRNLVTITLRGQAIAHFQWSRVDGEPKVRVAYGYPPRS